MQGPKRPTSAVVVGSDSDESGPARVAAAQAAWKSVVRQLRFGLGLKGRNESRRLGLGLAHLRVGLGPEPITGTSGLGLRQAGLGRPGNDSRFGAQ